MVGGQLVFHVTINHRLREAGSKKRIHRCEQLATLLTFVVLNVELLLQSELEGYHFKIMIKWSYQAMMVS